jgi:hypothetical protein
VRDGVAYGQQRCARVRRVQRGARARLRGRVGRAGHRQQQGSARTELQRKAASNENAQAAAKSDDLRQRAAHNTHKRRMRVKGVSRVACVPTSSRTVPCACTTSQPGKGGPSQHVGVQGRRRNSGGQVCSRGAGAAEDMQAARRSEVLFAAGTPRARAPRASKSALRRSGGGRHRFAGGLLDQARRGPICGGPSTHQRKSRIQGVLDRPSPVRRVAC